MTRAFFVTSFIAINSAFAGGIREFDLKTIQRLGNELTRESQRPDRGATTPERKRAKQTAVAALKGKLFSEVDYDYVVLNDPERSGFLVYALAKTKRKDQILTGGHFRVTVSGDGSAAERIDFLSQLMRHPKERPDSSTVAIVSSQIASNIPVETWIYSSDLFHLPMFVVTMDGRFWLVANGKIENRGNVKDRKRKT